MEIFSREEIDRDKEFLPALNSKVRSSTYPLETSNRSASTLPQLEA